MINSARKWHGRAILPWIGKIYIYIRSLFFFLRFRSSQKKRVRFRNSCLSSNDFDRSMDEEWSCSPRWIIAINCLLLQLCFKFWPNQFQHSRPSSKVIEMPLLPDLKSSPPSQSCFVYFTHSSHRLPVLALNTNSIFRISLASPRKGDQNDTHFCCFCC